MVIAAAAAASRAWPQSPAVDVEPEVNRARRLAFGESANSRVQMTLAVVAIDRFISQFVGRFAHVASDINCDAGPDSCVAAVNS